LCCAALLRARRPNINRGMAAAVSVATLSAVIVARAGRGFYGRPTIGTGQLVEFGIYAAIALGGMCLLLRPGWRSAAPGVAAVIGLTVGLGFTPALTRGFVLAALPAAVQRVAVSATLAGGISSFLVLILGDRGTEAPRPDRRTRRAQSKGARARNRTGKTPAKRRRPRAA